jgi:hypothetical protein
VAVLIYSTTYTTIRNSQLTTNNTLNKQTDNIPISYSYSHSHSRASHSSVCGGRMDEGSSEDVDR